MFKSLRCSLRSGWIAVLLLVISVWGALAQGNSNFVPGELIVSVPAGTAPATVADILRPVNAEIVLNYGSVDFERRWNLYWVRMKSGQPTPTETAAAVATLKKDVRVKYAGLNHRVKYDQAGPSVTPNDPLYRQMWGLPMIRMPQAWTLEKGKANVAVVIADSGVDIDHPDLKDHLAIGDPNLGPLNATNPPNFTTDPRPIAGQNEEHGTHVAGTAIGTTNNGVGISGVVWENATLVPVKLGLSEAAVIAAWNEILRRAQARTDIRFVVNNSFNLGDSADDIPPAAGADPAADAMLNLARNGVVMMMSGGNRGAPGDTNPPRRLARMAAAHPNIFSVAAVNQNGTRAIYSSYRPTNTIAAPGGEKPTGGEDPEGILSTWPVATNLLYHYEQGTSMATPHMTGVAALLLSVPGVRPDDLKAIITSTARRVPGAAVPSADYGFGIVDAYAALLKVAVGVTVVTPDGSGGKNAGKPGTPLPVETLKPVISIAVSQVTPDKLTITVDGTTIPVCETPGQTTPCYNIENITATVKDTNGNDVPSVYNAVIRNLVLSPGSHTIVVTGVKPGTPDDITVTDTRTFTIEPHLIPAGRAMISIPYYQAEGATAGTPVTPETYFGSDFRLARWVPEQGRYAFYSSFGVHDPYASFNPPDVIPHQDGDLTPRWPLGLGFFSDTESAKPVLTQGQALTDRPFVIPLKGNGSGSDRFISWNMIGDPFPFDVPFNALLVDTPTGRISITEAVTRGLILPNIFSYDNANGYTYRTLPDGALRAWQAHWIGVTSRENISLVVPPAASPTRSATIGAQEPVANGGWNLRLSVRSKNLKDTFNFIGVSSRAADGYGREDAPKPPMSAPFVSLGITHSDWGRQSGMYASDVRAAGGVKTWTVNVDTDQSNADMTVNWAAKSFPRDYKLSIKDETSGQVVDMRTRNTITFNTGANGLSRKFTVTARPSTGGGLRITNLAVRSSSRGGSSIGFTMTADATYDVKVLNGTGAPINTISTRAAGAGDVSLFWNGKDSAGRSVASGNYIVQIRASTSDGDSVRVIYPFAIVR
jgi:subtilisin family serine protease